jgi:hypothetical protein
MFGFEPSPGLTSELKIFDGGLKKSRHVPFKGLAAGKAVL